MNKKPKTLPEFKSEEEELRFWDEHDPSDCIEGPSDVIVRLKERKRRTITMRLDESLYQELRAVAKRHGLPYPRLMRERLRQSLTTLAAEEKRASRR